MCVYRYFCYFYTDVSSTSGQVLVNKKRFYEYLVTEEKRIGGTTGRQYGRPLSQTTGDTSRNDDVDGDARVTTLWVLCGWRYM